MAKKLTVQFPEKCIGCELCVMEVQRQLNRVGLDDSLIRIFKRFDEVKKESRYEILLDPRVQETDIEIIAKICPTAVFSIEESDSKHEFL
jgi:Fe-S-cluster-containing hydrogenase component 2